MTRKLWRLGLVVTLVLSLAAGAVAQPRRGAQATNQDPHILMGEALDLAFEAMNLVWVDWFERYNVPNRPEVYLAFIYPGQVYHTNCSGRRGQKATIDSEWDNAMYCHRDSVRDPDNGHLYHGVIIMPIASMLEMFNEDIWGRTSTWPGDFVSVAIAAHEWAHHVTFELADQYDRRLPAAPNTELIADCLAGEFMATFRNFATLTPADEEAIMHGLALIADPRPDSGTHGTANQRREAFQVGVSRSGDEGKKLCFDTYWPALGVR